MRFKFKPVRKGPIPQSFRGILWPMYRNKNWYTPGAWARKKAARKRALASKKINRSRV